MTLYIPNLNLDLLFLHRLRLHFAMTVLSSFPVQLFYVQRIQKLSTSTSTSRFKFSFLSTLTFVLSLTSFVSGFVASILQATELNSSLPLIPNSDLSAFSTLSWLFYSSSTLADLSISISIFFFINKKNSVFSTSQKVLNRIQIISIESGLILSLFSVALIISVALSGKTFLGLVFSFPFGNVYTISLLVTLNARSLGRRRPRSLAMPHSPEGSPVLPIISSFPQSNKATSRVVRIEKPDGNENGGNGQGFNFVRIIMAKIHRMINRTHIDGKGTKIKEVEISKLFRIPDELVQPGVQPVLQQIQSPPQAASHSEAPTQQFPDPPVNQGSSGDQSSRGWVFISSTPHSPTPSTNGLEAQLESGFLEVGNQSQTQSSGMSFWCRGLRSFQSHGEEEIGENKNQQRDVDGAKLGSDQKEVKKIDGLEERVEAGTQLDLKNKGLGISETTVAVPRTSFQ